MIVPSYDCFGCDQTFDADIVMYDNGWRSVFDDINNFVSGEFEIEINKTSEATIVIPVECCTDIRPTDPKQRLFEIRFRLNGQLWWRGKVESLTSDQVNGTYQFTARNGFYWLDAVSFTDPVSFTGDLADYGALLVQNALNRNLELGYTVVTHSCGIPVTRDIDASPTRTFLDVLDDETELYVTVVGDVFHVGCPDWETICLNQDDFLDLEQFQYVYTDSPTRVFVDGEGSLVGFAEDTTRIPRVDAHFDMNHVGDQAELDAFALRKLNETSSVFNPPKDFKINSDSGVCASVFLPGTKTCFQIVECGETYRWETRISRVKVLFDSTEFSVDVSTV